MPGLVGEENSYRESSSRFLIPLFFFFWARSAGLGFVWAGFFFWAITLMNKLTSMKYDGFLEVRKNVMEICDIYEKLKDLDTTVSENFLVQFVLNSLPSQFI